MATTTTPPTISSNSSVPLSVSNSNNSAAILPRPRVMTFDSYLNNSGNSNNNNNNNAPRTSKLSMAMADPQCWKLKKSQQQVSYLNQHFQYNNYDLDFAIFWLMCCQNRRFSHSYSKVEHLMQLMHEISENESQLYQFITFSLILPNNDTICKYIKSSPSLNSQYTAEQLSALSAESFAIAFCQVFLDQVYRNIDHLQLITDYVDAATLETRQPEIYYRYIQYRRKRGKSL